jgi:hypothetical protein
MLGFSLAAVLGVAMTAYTFRLREVREWPESDETVSA